ncbi:MAG: PEP/pyruvate-binding domain-containing protein [Acidobacteriota bacterium]
MGLTTLVRKLFGRDQWRPLIAQRDTKAALRLSYLAFKDLITSNDELLEIVADIEQKLETGSPFGMTYVRFRAVACATHTYRMILCLDKLSARRYQELHFVFAGIQKAIEPLLSGTRPAHATCPLVLRLSDIDATSADDAGGKAANVAEVRNRARLPVPDGFVVSTTAFAAFLAHEQLGEDIRAKHDGLAPDDQQSLHDVSEELQALISAHRVPGRLVQSILGAYDDLAARCGTNPRVSVRSSAVGEDGEFSFAGQYTSVLNVGRDGLVDAYRRVVASLYTPRAIFYRAIHGIPDEQAAMAVLCMVQIDSVASGVACSVDPGRPDAGTLLITGAWGLGITTVGGSVSPDVWEVARAAGTPVLRARLGVKDTRADASPEGGVGFLELPESVTSTYCLTDTQVRDLAAIVLAAEAHYGKPQEVEWALDRAGRFVLLQSRPLHVRAVPAAVTDLDGHADGHALILTGASASAGCASGPVYHMSESDDTSRFPDRAVLVARHSSPKYVKVMARAAAIITDIGATTGHMASLAREFGVPAVLDTRSATTTLEPGQVVTVDANRGAVYEGRVDCLLSGSAAAPARTMTGTPTYAILRQVADRIAPLTLTDPKSVSFRPDQCRTFHDIARFAHEKAFGEMFRMSDRVADVSHRAVRLAERLPFELHLIDIGGGIAQSSPGEPAVRAAAIVSEPMAALLRGMMNPQLRWWEPRGISLSGFFAVATEAMMNPAHDADQRRLGDKSYAIVAESYCNFSSRIGYHFAAVDAYCTDSLSRNYVSFRFKGGAADDARRARRCALIGEVLKKLDFQTDRRGDLVNARLRKYPREALLERLDLVGRLIVATRQLDMRMGRGTPVDWFVQAFFAGNYLFDPEQGRAAAGGSPP